MLIEFNVTNFRSIKHRTTLSMVKGTGDEHLETHVIPPGAAGVPLLRVAAIYGANASGKSTIIKAIDALQELVIRSSSKQKGDVLKEIEPYAFDSASASAPTEFEVTFVAEDSVRYTYGLSATKSVIHEEWLFAYPKGRAQRWFTRTRNSESGTFDWDLGDQLKGKKSIWAEATRENALFLSTAVQLNSEQLKPAYEWLKGKLNVWNHGFFPSAFSAEISMQKEATRIRRTILAFMQAADLDIVDFKVEEAEDSTRAAVMQDILPERRSFYEQALKTQDAFKITTYHRAGKSKVGLDIKDESDGTRKLFSLAAPLAMILALGETLVVDELSENLHPLIFKLVVSLFVDPEMNTGNAQLIFTTHDTSILTHTFLRRDQIWFADKGKDRTTRLVPLSDYKVRKGFSRLKEEYLGGAYRGVPVVRKAKLMSAAHAQALAQINESMEP
ncbi:MULTISPECIES: ATP/GTP-binding protein [unclassified Caballeronia]|uniref:AAA family ATPase n=1 Tax=unclassified Caballeronia TaxID=2646786 RepID=UPI00158CF608|nr:MULTISPECIES: ATP-binding protein [unclassified Caballeronia]QSN61217.1 ATP-binding protein [Caballeronia sp. M1242]